MLGSPGWTEVAVNWENEAQREAGMVLYSTKSPQQRHFNKWQTPLMNEWPLKPCRRPAGNEITVSFKEMARKLSNCSNKQQWYVPQKTQGPPNWEDKIGSGTLVPHASLKIKPTCKTKVYMRSQHCKDYSHLLPMFQDRAGITDLRCHRLTACTQWLHYKSFLMWPSGCAVGNSVLPKHL